LEQCIFTSYDATFDENFDTALVFDTHPFQGSLAIRRAPTSNPIQLETFNEQEPSQSTGSITDFNNTVLPQQTEEGSKKSVTDQYDNTAGVNQDDTEQEYVIVQAPEDTEDLAIDESQDTQESQYPTRL
jgi:hypothetical protein